ncbi:hypothetical protein CEXT_795661 [Caerostris extrusa]|uniref:Uncharacterized protein n=1 Tax=Caerostris extrusa TaxID=172846 RepID=A0AAV4X5U1_CAEEX|nr:hypothetical protein CEXT_795661 [Caerostris extrusa]
MRNTLSSSTVHSDLNNGHHIEQVVVVLCNTFTSSSMIHFDMNSGYYIEQVEVADLPHPFPDGCMTV